MFLMFRNYPKYLYLISIEGMVSNSIGKSRIINIFISNKRISFILFFFLGMTCFSELSGIFLNSLSHYSIYIDYKINLNYLMLMHFRELIKLV